jgi:hypothetical protein
MHTYIITLVIYFNEITKTQIDLSFVFERIKLPNTELTVGISRVGMSCFVMSFFQRNQKRRNTIQFHQSLTESISTTHKCISQSSAGYDSDAAMRVDQSSDELFQNVVLCQQRKRRRCITDNSICKRSARQLNLSNSAFVSLALRKGSTLELDDFFEFDLNLPI